VILFGDAIKGESDSQAGRVRRFARHPGEVRLPGGLFEFARRVRHGYAAGAGRIWSYDQILAAADLDALWVTGEIRWKNRR
jgi:hypothetical protein